MGKILEKLTEESFYAMAFVDETGTVVYVDSDGLYYNTPCEERFSEIEKIYLKTKIEKVQKRVPYKIIPVKVTPMYKTETTKL